MLSVVGAFWRYLWKMGLVRSQNFALNDPTSCPLLAP